METCGLPATTYPPNPPNSSKPGTATSLNTGATGSKASPAKGAKDGLHVNFTTEKVEERKKKFLTAKYGTHQMNLIKKRLGVEMWVYDQLQLIFKSAESDVELDLDELLDIEDEKERRAWLDSRLGKLANGKQSQDSIKKFIDELLKRATTL